MFRQLSNPIKKEEALSSIIIGLFSTIIPSLLFSVWDGLIVAILLFLIFRFFFKKYYSLLFTFTFGILLVNSTIFLLILNYVNGEPFLTGGDDFLFYNAGKGLYQSRYDINIEVDGIPLWLSNYPAYLFIISIYYELLSLIGLNSLHFYNFTLFKVALGALVPVLIYKIGELTSLKVSKLTLIVILFFPLLILHTTSFLRESIISFFFVLGVYSILRIKPSFYRILIIFLLTIIVFFIRPVHSFLLILFYFLYYFLNRKNNFWLNFIFAIIIFIIGLIFLNYNNSGILLQYQNTQNSYRELSEMTAQNGSLGVKLYGSDNPFLWPIKYLYYLMSPIPPPIFEDLNLITIYITIGSVLWYLILLGFLKSGFRKVNRINPYFISLFLLFLIAAAVGVNTTKDPRHLIFIYPLIIPYGLKELSMIPKFVIFITFFSFLILASIGYIILKFAI